jgi:phosphate transport system permease protein
MSGPPSSSVASWGSIPTAAARISLARRLYLDRLAGWVVRAGGLAIIASIVAILFVIAYEVYPLLEAPTLEHDATRKVAPSTEVLGVAVDEYRGIAYRVDETGLRFVALDAGGELPMEPPDLGGATVTSASPLAARTFAVGLSDGRARVVRVDFEITYDEGVRTSAPRVIWSEPARLDEDGGALVRLAFADAPQGPVIAAVLEGGEIALSSVKETRPLIGDPIREESRARLRLEGSARPTEIVIDERGDNLFVGTNEGSISRFELRSGKPVLAETLPVAGSPVSKLGFLVGDRTLVVGSDDGTISSWQLLRAPEGGERLTRIYEFAAHEAPIVGFSASRRHKGFFTGDRSGRVNLHYGTTGETLLEANLAEGEVGAVAFAPKADGLVIASRDGTLESWTLHAPHPETTLRSLFGKLWYEGYDEPEYVWQSTGGTDDFEAKLSLTPLIYGTMKGTAYALVIAIPLALLGALYASQFMHPALKAYVKPTVEIMAALPSVVLGFIAGLWLAPAVEHVVPGLFLLPFVLTVSILAAVWAFRFLPAAIRLRIRPGTEVFLLIPLVLGAGWLSIQLGYGFERFMLGGDYRRWLLEVLGLTYDQRNSLVVGLAMGFAIIPIIFTITEDSLSSVPSHLRAGSLALGATPWQTAIRVILPTASPGIFSAVMIGFGRAVGETMIVLMATGNTPVMDASIFSGFRALSANIAVELPEAPEGGTLYRVLFLAALILFAITFVVNTAAELVRLRLRKRYRVL